MRRFLAVFDPATDGDRPPAELEALAVQRAKRAGCEVVDGDITIDQCTEIKSWSPIIATVPVNAERNQYIHLGGTDANSWPPQALTSTPRSRHTGQKGSR